MEKLDLQIFRELRQEIIEYMTKYREAEEREEYLSKEEEEQFLSRYKEIIGILSEHDLSDIDFSEWKGMYIYISEETPLDFSKTKANIDFSIIVYNNTDIGAFPNLKSCQIKNFDFEEYYYCPEMFDEEYRKENEGHFLSVEIPEDVADRFYERGLTLTDIQNNPELANKFGKINLDYGLADIYRIVGREEFCKLDAQFVDVTGYEWRELLTANPNLRTAEEIMPVLYQSAREKIIGYSNGGFYFRQDQLGERFRKQYPDLFLSEEVPKNVRTRYYSHHLSLEEFSENLQYFEGKTVAQFFWDFGKNKKIISLYGEGIYQLFVDYKPVMDKILSDYTAMQTIEVPTGPITEEQRKEIMSSAISTCFFRNGCEQLQNWEELKMIQDFVSLENFPLTPNTRDFIEKYGIDKIIESGLDIKYLFLKGKILNNIEGIIERCTKGEISIDAVRETMEQTLYDGIKERSIEDFEDLPLSFQEKHPELFLPKEIDGKLRDKFYGGKLSFEDIRKNPQIKELLLTKDIRRAFKKEYEELFNRFDSSTLMKIGTRNPEKIEKMVQNHKEDVLENWYKSTGFVPHHVVMLNFPEGEIDSFLGNSKRWSQLMKIDNYNLNDDSKAAILKASYAMGVFQGDDDGFNKTMKLFTDVPQELSQEEYEKVISLFNSEFDPFRWDGSNLDPKQKNEEMKSLFEQAYTLNDDGRYVLRMDKQKKKDSVKMVREILEKAQIPRILTPEKAHQMFDSFAMEYNPDFVRFFNDNIEEILSNPEYTKDIATIQRQFKDIVRANAGRRLTLDVAQDYIRSIAYTDIEIGNEGVAEQAKIAGYSQKDFEAIQSLFNEGEVRDFSSIPRIQGKTNRYTYEMLRCDDPLALTIGTLTDCCQEIHGAGETSMEHSVVSPDGRVFCVKDNEGRLVAQSWFWRNQYTGCFDNIEIPARILELYEKQHPDIGRKGLTTDVLEVYKKAAQDLMQEDSKVYQELLENGTITQEQYDALLLGKVTIGLGYNDIKDAILHDKTIHEETDKVGVKGTERLPHVYTDASTQYTIAERDGIVKSEHENLYVHQDDVPVFDGTNMSSIVLLTMKRMEQATGRDNLLYLSERSDEENLSKSQRIINSIAREYGLDPNSTKVMATARIALIYSKDKDKIKISDLLSSPLKTGLTEEQKQRATAHIMDQVKKAIKQMGVQDSEVDLSSLSEKQQKMLQSVMQEIEKENDERGER